MTQRGPRNSLPPRPARLAWAVLFLTALGGCSAYGLNSGRVQPGLESVAVPYFANESTEPDVEIVLTDAIINGLLQNRTLRVVDEDQADAIVRGTVVSYQVEEAFFDEERQAEQYEIRVRCEVAMIEAESGEPIAGPEIVRGTGTYFLDEGPEAEDVARNEAADEIVQGILNLVIEDW